MNPHNTRDRLPEVEFVPQPQVFCSAGTFTRPPKFGSVVFATGGSGGSKPIRARAQKPRSESPSGRGGTSARGRGPKAPRIKSKNRSGRKQ